MVNRYHGTLTPPRIATVEAGRWKDGIAPERAIHAKNFIIEAKEARR